MAKLPATFKFQEESNHNINEWNKKNSRLYFLLSFTYIDLQVLSFTNHQNFSFKR